jgi:hypothetical protein
MYKFEKYGTLMRYDGIPLYIGNRLLTKRWFVWWWPINWIAIVVFLIPAIYLTIRNR